VILSHLKDESYGQGFLFEESYHDSRKERLMKTVDAFNNRTNSGKIFMAAEGIAQPWFMNQTHKSKRFTTRWDEMLEI
jgi:DNA polymerase V